VIVSTVLFALLAATFAVLTVAWLKRLPTLNFCPTCAHRTQAVMLPRLMRPLQRWISRRWCPDCEWESIGRKGPEFIPGRKLAHDSGFLWGANVVGENAGFQWAPLDPPESPDPSAGPPDHRSGFRFGEDPAPAKVRAPAPGFSWSGARPPASSIRMRDPRSAFSWGGRPNGETPSGNQARRNDCPTAFQWGLSPDRQPPQH